MTKEWRTEINKNANGGTELLMDKLHSLFGDQLEPFQIIPSRLTELQSDKIRILWCHDTAEDGMNQHLTNGGWSRFHKIVFVSYTQQQEFANRYGIPPSKMTVLHNAIDPIDVDIETKSQDRIELVYTPTPQRGLGILVPVFQKLEEKYEDQIHLHVYSSFALYGWGQEDQKFEPLFEMIRNNPRMTYYGTVPNADIRESLKSKHIFAYPSVWKETGCLCLMEAMSAGLACVHSSLGALPETSANWTFMYDFHEDYSIHANRFYAAMDHTIEMMIGSPPITELKSQKSYTDLFYSWKLRQYQWQNLFDTLLMEYKDQDLSVQEPKQVFRYGA